jgi:hypothetical protein
MQRPPARPESIPLERFVAVIASSGIDQGECAELPAREVFGTSALRAVAFLIPNSTTVQRRVLVAVDSLGEVRRFSDVRIGSRSTHVSIDFTSGVASAWNEGGGQDRALSRGSPDAFFNASNLGPPAAIAQQVIQRCGSLLQPRL